MKFYHGTTEETWKTIQRESILFGRRYITDNDGNIIKEVDRCTYLAVDAEEAKEYGDVVLQVEYDPYKNPQKNNYVEGCWQVRVYEPISIDNVKKMKNNMEHKENYEIPPIETEYYIPEGMEAVIEGDKVIIRRKESDDEKIRKAIINAIHDYAYRLEEKIPTEWLTWLEKQGVQKPVNVKPHLPDGSITYDKGFEEAQEYLSERGFDIPWNDCDVFVDERYITQTIANVLTWGDEHPKQKPVDINPSEFNSRLEQLLRCFQILPKEKLVDGLRFYLNVVENDGVYVEPKPNGGIVLEDFNGGDGFYKVNLDYLCKMQVEDIERLVKSWKAHNCDKVEKPQEWTEEDKKMIDSIIEDCRYIGEYLDYPTKEETELYEEAMDKINWLKSIEQRLKKG